MDMRGSGIYTEVEEIAIDPCKNCDGHEGLLVTDDWGRRTLQCADCGTEQEMPEQEPDWDLDPDWG